MRTGGFQLIVWVALQKPSPRSKDDRAVEARNEKQQEDRAFLEKRHGEINKAFKHWYLNQSSHRPNTRTVEGTALKKIRKRVVERLPEGENRDMCEQWAYDMAEMIHRMHKHWTEIERDSLNSFLTRFEDTLNNLLTPPHVESAYHPPARQHAADPEKVVELFVSGAGFYSCAELKLTTQRHERVPQKHWNAEKIRDRVVSRSQLPRQMTSLTKECARQSTVRTRFALLRYQPWLR